MPLRVTTDHAEITTVLDRFLAADPVAGTILGTIRSVLEPTAWSASDGELLAVRSADEYPVVLAGPWAVGSPTFGELGALLGDLPDIRGVSGPPTVVDELAVRLAGARPIVRMAQRLLRCDQLAPPVGVQGSPALAAAPQRDVVHRWFAAFLAEGGDPSGRPAEGADRALDSGLCRLWLDASGEPVSMAARRPVVAGSGRVGPVYTPPDHRGRGYGSAVTAAATADVLAEGGVPVLFTDLTNPTSNKIYQLIGYRPVEDRAVWSSR